MSKETFNHIFLDFGCRDSNVVYSMDDLYHQIQRIADMVRRGEGIREEGDEGRKSKFKMRHEGLK